MMRKRQGLTPGMKGWTWLAQEAWAFFSCNRRALSISFSQEKHFFRSSLGAPLLLAGELPRRKGFPPFFLTFLEASLLSAYIRTDKEGMPLCRNYFFFHHFSVLRVNKILSLAWSQIFTSNKFSGWVGGFWNQFLVAHHNCLGFLSHVIQRLGDINTHAVLLTLS